MSRTARRSPMVLQVPDTAQPEAYFAGLLASAVVGVAGVTTLFLTAVIFVRTSGQVAHPERYTTSGVNFIHPEHETVFFLTACALGVGLALALSIRWNRRLRRGVPVPAPGRPATASGLVAVAGCGGAAVAVGLLAFLSGRNYVLRNVPVPRVTLVALVVVVGLCVVFAAAGARSRFSWCPPWPALGESASSWPERSRPAIVDAVLPMVVVAILFVPAPRILAGRTYRIDGLGHWNFFAMGTTNAFVHGAALGTQVHSQYGLGWPVLFGLLKPVLSVSYGHMILLAGVTTSLYFIGVYLLLRVIAGGAAWAAAGTLLSLLLQVFSGNFVSLATNVLDFPSISVLRRPVDVWVFLALALHLRTKHPAWAVIAGMLTGLALAFSTDTGLYLLAVFLLYLGCIGMMEDRRHVPRLAAVAAALAVFLAVVGIGSRWTLVSVAFWKSWLEPIAQGAAGYTALPMVGRADMWGLELPSGIVLAAFVAIVVVYLVVVCQMAIKVAHRRATSIELLVGCLSAYGLLSLTSFVGRSEPLELPHLLVPFAVVVTVLAARAQGRLMALMRRRAKASGVSPVARVMAAVIPLLVVCLLGMALTFNQSFRDYPGLLQRIGKPTPPDGMCLIAVPHDVCGLPATLAPDVQQFQVVTAEMRRLADTGRVALIDYQETYIVGTDLAPWGPYAPLLPVLFTQRQLQAAMAQLRRGRPTYVLIRPVAAYPSFYQDTAAAFGDLLHRSYTLDHMAGPFEVHELRH